jgi:hypothetical protein
MMMVDVWLIKFKFNAAIKNSFHFSLPGWMEGEVSSDACEFASLNVITHLSPHCLAPAREEIVIICEQFI